MRINDNALRPLTLDDFIGQDNLKAKLNIYIKGAKKRNECLDHILFYGPSGLGKTTLSNIIANEMNASIKILIGSTIEKPCEIISALLNLNNGDILFIDEIHRLPLNIQEILYSAMEDYYIEVINYDSNNNAKPIHIDLPPFTLIGATTKLGLLSEPLRNRFAILEHLDYYNYSDTCKIIKRLSNLYRVKIDHITIDNIALRTRGIPRIIGNIFKRIRDYVTSLNKDEITETDVNYFCKLLKIDKKGLNDLDYQILSKMYQNFNNKPVGFETLALILNEDLKTLESFNEPYLLRIGFIERTKQGRVLTLNGKLYIEKYILNHKK